MKALLALFAVAGIAAAKTEYRITADVEKDRISGQVEITYTNETGTALNVLPVWVPSEPERTGFAGRPAKRSGPSTLEITLEPPLGAGRKLILSSKFSSPLQPGTEFGYRSNANWYPRVLTFRDGRFDARELEPQSFDIILTAPAAEVIATSGLRNASRTLPDGRKEHKYRASNITKFGIALSPDFQVTQREAAGTRVLVYFLPSQREWFGEKIPNFATRIIAFYKELYGFYPQPVLSIIPGVKRSVGGFPFAGNLVAIHDSLNGTSDHFPEWITSHEIGHMYWGYETVLDSPNLHHWLGLGLGIYSDRLYSERHNPAALEEHQRFVRKYVDDGVARGRKTTLVQSADALQKAGYDTGNVVSHGKGFAVIQMLEETMGRERFLKLTRVIQRRYRNRFLSVKEFQAAAEQVHGSKLDSFFDDWVYNNRILRYEITGMEAKPSGTVEVAVKNAGTAKLPLTLELVLESGQRLRKPIAGNQELQTVTFQTDVKPRFARLDPDQRTGLYSPDGKSFWGRPFVDVSLKLPDVAWNTNTARLTLRNADRNPRKITVNIHVRAAGRWGVAWTTTHEVPAGSQIEIDREFFVPPAPGHARIAFVASDPAEAYNYPLQESFAEFPLNNKRINPYKERPWPQGGVKELPPFRIEERGALVFYFLPTDSYTTERIEALASKRAAAFESLKAKLNPGFSGKVAIFLYPDEATKTTLTGHRGLGLAAGDMIAEVFNEKQQVDTNHELVHIIASSIGTPPAIFSEGLATYLQEDEKWRGNSVDSLAKTFLQDGLLWPAQTIFAFDDIGPDATKPRIAYPQAGSFIKHLMNAYGPEKVMQAYRELKQGSENVASNLEKFERIFGLSLDQADRNWRNALAGNTMTKAELGATGR